MKTKISKYMDIKRVEFIVTWECAGRCKHCQAGDSINKKSSHNHVLANYAVDAVEKLSTVFDITSVMTFGGEPLYYPDVVAAIHKKATDCGIAIREVITNGYFTNDAEKSKSVAQSLYDAGVNHLPISVDAFHQEYIPIEPVYQFVRDVIDAKIPDAFLHPAWLVNENHENPYNAKTREILERFSDLGIPASKHNVDLHGSAARFLSEYYPEQQPLNPADPNLSTPCDGPANVGGFCIMPNGDVSVCGFVIGNIYKEDILDIVSRYNPYENEGMTAIINGGIAGLLSYAEKQGLSIDISKYYSSCWDACNAIAECLSCKK
jgi:MoaA/NifB/PqqE/SkfB family radical SAM enzyme